MGGKGRRHDRKAPAGEPERIKARQVEALELRKAGKGFREIAREIGVSLGQAYADVDAALAELEDLKREKAERVLELDLARIDGIIEGHYEAAKTGDEKSANVVLKALERRARLLAMDKDTKEDAERDLLALYLLHQHGVGRANGHSPPGLNGEPPHTTH